jgi:hypothetical protein
MFVSRVLHDMCASLCFDFLLGSCLEATQGYKRRPPRIFVQRLSFNYYCNQVASRVTFLAPKTGVCELISYTY